MNTYVVPGNGHHQVRAGHGHGEDRKNFVDPDAETELEVVVPVSGGELGEISLATPVVRPGTTE